MWGKQPGPRKMRKRKVQAAENKALRLLDQALQVSRKESSDAEKRRKDVLERWAKRKDRQGLLNTMRARQWVI